MFHPPFQTNNPEPVAPTVTVACLAASVCDDWLFGLSMPEAEQLAENSPVFAATIYHRFVDVANIYLRTTTAGASRVFTEFMPLWLMGRRFGRQQLALRIPRLHWDEYLTSAWVKGLDEKDALVHVQWIDKRLDFVTVWFTD